MKLFDSVAILTDASMQEEAEALRAFLECLRLRVQFHRVVQRRNIAEFFGPSGPKCDATVIVCHGGDVDGARRIVLEAVDSPTPDGPDGWHPVSVELTPASIPHVVGQASGVLMTLACGGGMSGLPEAFLSCGYEAYVASAEPYQDANACLLFLMSVFYFLRAEDRDFAPKAFSLEEAVDKAAAVDAGWPFGTSAFRCFTKAGVSRAS